ncbi:hypothetical protein [Rhizomonospora bruguierae]|uniref:hypothetical protein n=1 Tax=Rhizomonospora bruguierae TaxID=1581705 RepID=UPI001BCA8927|nr:hypothetical protein [Micromonospora sp. NBRC 107566]
MKAFTALAANAAATHCDTCGRPRDHWNRGDRLYSPTSPECPRCVHVLIDADKAASRLEGML